MKIHRATSADNSIKLHTKPYEETNIDSMISNHLDEMFGSKNGDYFILNAQTRSDFRGKKFRILLVEDKEMDKHQLYFEIITPLTNPNNMV